MSTILYLIIIVFIISLVSLNKLQKYKVVYVKSTVDNQEYLVRDLPDKQQAADLLANVKANMMKLTNYVYANKDTKYVEYKSYIEQLYTGMQKVVIHESDEDNDYTSYSINKGEQIVFCIRSKYTGQLHDINLIMYVAIHEMAHVACPEYGHTPLFKKIFAFLITVAIQLGIYKKVDFHNHPVEYCGLIITESIV
jgi:hypothetical protein